MKILSFLLISFCLLFGLEGKVIKVVDGDTIWILPKGGERVKIRLYGIDAPEMKDSGGKKSKKYLSELIAGKEVQIETHGHDKYKRVIGIVYLDGTDINGKMVKDGYARAYFKYSKKYKFF